MGSPLDLSEPRSRRCASQGGLPLAPGTQYFQTLAPESPPSRSISHTPPLPQVTASQSSDPMEEFSQETPNLMAADRCLAAACSLLQFEIAEVGQGTGSRVREYREPYRCACCGSVGVKGRRVCLWVFYTQTSIEHVHRCTAGTKRPCRMWFLRPGCALHKDGLHMYYFEYRLAYSNPSVLLVLYDPQVNIRAFATRTEYAHGWVGRGELPLREALLLRCRGVVSLELRSELVLFYTCSRGVHISKFPFVWSALRLSPPVYTLLILSRYSSIY